MPRDTRPDDELNELEAKTSDGDKVIAGLDPDITQDADPHGGS